MKFTHLKIVNFRSHKESTIPMDRLTVIRGANHSGKSTVQYALEWVLTGRCNVTDEGGRGQADLLRDGQPGRVEAMVTFNDGLTGIVAGTLTAAGRVSGCALDNRNLELAQSHWGYLQARPALLRCLTNTSYFLRLKATAQKELLASVTVPLEHDWDFTRTQIVEDVFPGVFGWGGTAPLTLIDAVYRRAFELRTLTNRDLAQLGQELEPAETPEHSEEEVRAQLKKLQARLAEISATSSRHATDYAKLVDARFSALVEQDRLKVQIEREEQAELQAKQRMLSKDQVKQREKEASHAEEAIKLEDKAVLVRGAIMQRDEQTKRLSTISGETCPTCTQPIGAELVNELREGLKSLADRERAQLEGLIEQRKALGNPDAARNALAAHKEAADVLAIIQTKLKSLRHDLAKLVVPDEPVKPEDPTREERDGLDAKIQTGQLMLTQVATLAERQRAANERLAKRDGLTMQLSKLELICKAFGPGDRGIKAQLIAAHIDAFALKMNRVLSRWGYYTRLQIEPEYRFVITRFEERQGVQDVQTFTLDQLSASEKYRFSVALQVALALTSAMNFVVVDEAEILDEAALKTLFRAVYDEDGLDQAIVISTGPGFSNGAPGAVFLEMTENDAGTQVTLLAHNEAVGV